MKRPLVIHPLLVAIFPTLFLYAQNVRQTSAGQIVVPIAISLGSVLVFWVLFWFVFRNRAKAGLAASILVFLLSTFGQFYGLLGKPDFFLLKLEFLLPATLLAFVAGVFFIRRARGDFGPVTRVLNVAAAVIVAINVFTIVSYQIGADREGSPQQASSVYAGTKGTDTVADTPSGSSTSAGGGSIGTANIPASDATSHPATEETAHGKPDIYLIVLDECGGPQTMERLFNYDSEPFSKSLEDMGFFVADNSSMYNSVSERAVASILNMEYTDENEPIEVTYDRIINNRVFSELRSHGYKFVYFGQYFDKDAYRFQVDLYVNYYETVSRGTVSSEFLNLLGKNTILNPLQNLVGADGDTQYFRECVLRTLDNLGQIPTSEEGPKFVYAHIMCPHYPYVFGPNGEVREDPSGQSNTAYFDQYLFITKTIQGVIQQILTKSTNDPIIILQSDHGPRWTGDWNNVLNAYHLPGDGNELLYDNISPVNSFRLVFNKYFGASYPLLPDK